MAKAVIIYWSATGNTESMAMAIERGIRNNISDVSITQVAQATTDMVEVADLVVLGCPAMGVEELEEYEFAPFYEEIKSLLSGKKVALFGSYDWGDGEWMRNWEEDVKSTGADLVEAGYIHLYGLDGEEEDALAFADRISK